MTLTENLMCILFAQILFFHQNKQFVNCKDPETGNTALHLASRHGQFVSSHLSTIVLCRQTHPYQNYIIQLIMLRKRLSVTIWVRTRPCQLVQ